MGYHVLEQVSITNKLKTSYSVEPADIFPHQVYFNHIAWYQPLNLLQNEKSFIACSDLLIVEGESCSSHSSYN